MVDMVVPPQQEGSTALLPGRVHRSAWPRCSLHPSKSNETPAFSFGTGSVQDAFCLTRLCENRYRDILAPTIMPSLGGLGRAR